MPADKNTEFLSSAMQRIQQRRWEVLAAQIEEKIFITIRVPAAVRNPQQTGGDQAIQVARDLGADGWTLSGFNYEDNHLIINLRHDRLE